VFWWGKFRKHKAAVKLHTMLDVKTQIPTYIYITGGSLLAVYGIWLTILLIMYLLCKKYSNCKTNHREKWWLGYL